jgi:hypothetical protein
MDGAVQSGPRSGIDAPTLIYYVNIVNQEGVS